MWLKWLPWRYAVSGLARSHGFLDPVGLLSRLHRFAQPSEVTVPVELLRAGVIFHARGLINSQAIQHNLDWVWPFWVESQFDPRNIAFIPRAFSITHVNLTHRNWTAIGRPDSDWYPLVDPRGLVTPHLDGWSIDLWVIPDNGEPLLPSRCNQVDQSFLFDDRLAVKTDIQDTEGQIASVAEVVRADGDLACQMCVRAEHKAPAWLAVAVRPANPEGVSFVHEIACQGDLELLVDRKQRVELSHKPQRVCMSEYRQGDVFQDVHFRNAVETAGMRKVECDVGMATAAALYRLKPQQPFELQIRIPRAEERHNGQSTAESSLSRVPATTATTDWQELSAQSCQLHSPDAHFNYLFQAAVHSLLLHTSVDAYPGPYTYKRFWFRDAAFLLQALMAIGSLERARRLLDMFSARQTRAGYFCSQEGEWDSNGEAIWILDRFRQLSGRPLPPSLCDSVNRGADWIRKKRIDPLIDRPHAGLMPAGFSAEHLGPNDYYYWDDFWSVAGLQSAAAILDASGRHDPADGFRIEANSLLQSIDRSIAQTVPHRDRKGVPASPSRRMDSGAIGSLAAGYPLQLWEARDPRLLATAEFLLEKCLVKGGFFQDMIHSGINVYLTLHLAQVLLRAGDARYADLMQAVAQAASATGQWPEAIHPHTGGGCMGDGQHVWASADWIMMIRNCFVREENGQLLLCTGVPSQWLETCEPIRFGPTLTPYGPISLELRGGKEVALAWQADWHGMAPEITVPDGYTITRAETLSEST